MCKELLPYASEDGPSKRGNTDERLCPHECNLIVITKLKVDGRETAEKDKLFINLPRDRASFQKYTWHLFETAFEGV